MRHFSSQNITIYLVQDASIAFTICTIIIMQNFHNISAKIDDLSESYKRVLYPSFQPSLISSILFDPKPKEIISQPSSSQHTTSWKGFWNYYLSYATFVDSQKLGHSKKCNCKLHIST